MSMSTCVTLRVADQSRRIRGDRSSCPFSCKRLKLGKVSNKAYPSAFHRSNCASRQPITSSLSHPEDEMMSHSRSKVSTSMRKIARLKNLHALAILTYSDASYSVAEMHLDYQDNVRIFADRDSAIVWLDSLLCDDTRI